MIQYLPANERTAQPWKNGGGVTREVAVWPPGADFETFEWRVSIATVDAEGPFSRFAGIDRVLTILNGRLILQFDATETISLSETSEPFEFSGETPYVGRPDRGAVVDLNVMVRRGRISAKVRRINQPAPLIGSANTLCLVALDNCTINSEPLQPLDAITAARGDRLDVNGPWPGLIAIDFADIP